MNVARAAAAPDSLARALTLSIVSHGHGALLQRLLTDLAQSAELAGVTVVVTLNLAAEELDVAPYRALDLIVVRNATPQGFARNHNRAFARCRTPWFAILNPDLRIADARCFSKMIGAAGSVEGCALLGPVVRNPSGEIEDSVRSNLTPGSLLRRALRGPGAAPDTRRPARRGAAFYWLAGMFLLVDAEVFRGLRGFDERYFLYCEDYDLGARVYNAGHAVLQVPHVAVVHDARRGSHRSARHLKMHLGSLLRVWTSRAFWRVCCNSFRSPARRPA
jgi:GT2 family glycosyltransferase